MLCVSVRTGTQMYIRMFCRVELSAVTEMFCCTVRCAVREVSCILNIICKTKTAFMYCIYSPAVTLFFHIIPYHINEFVATGHEFRNSVEV